MIRFSLFTSFILFGSMFDAYAAQNVMLDELKAQIQKGVKLRHVAPEVIAAAKEVPTKQAQSLQSLVTKDVLANVKLKSINSNGKESSSEASVKSQSTHLQITPEMLQGITLQKQRKVHQGEKTKALRAQQSAVPVTIEFTQAPLLTFQKSSEDIKNEDVLSLLVTSPEWFGESVRTARFKFNEAEKLFIFMLINKKWYGKLLNCEENLPKAASAFFKSKHDIFENKDRIREAGHVFHLLSAIDVLSKAEQKNILNEEIKILQAPFESLIHEYFQQEKLFDAFYANIQKSLMAQIEMGATNLKKFNLENNTLALNSIAALIGNPTFFTEEEQQMLNWRKGYFSYYLGMFQGYKMPIVVDTKTYPLQIKHNVETLMINLEKEYVDQHAYDTDSYRVKQAWTEKQDAFNKELFARSNKIKAKARFNEFCYKAATIGLFGDWDAPNQVKELTIEDLFGDDHAKV